MKNQSHLISQLDWGGGGEHVAAKQVVAKQVAERVSNGQVIGFGSGSTSLLAIEAIAQRIQEEKMDILAIPTSHEVELYCIKLNIFTTSLLRAKPDWCFDGADEIDPKGNMIKGRGGAMLKEKLVMSQARKIYILADKSKLVGHLGARFPIPVEVMPLALTCVESQLAELGAVEIVLRKAQKKDGPVITENGNLILDVKFDKMQSGLDKKIKQLPGVMESGLFMGFDIEVISA